MASRENKFQAKAVVEKCDQFLGHLRCHLDACNRHENSISTQEQWDDNEIVLHLQALRDAVKQHRDGLTKVGT